MSSLGKRKRNDKITELEETLKDLKCTICLELFIEPTTLSCGHSFCLECIQAIPLNSNNLSRKCPLCQAASLHSLSPNIILKNMLQIVGDASYQKRVSEHLETKKIEDCLHRYRKSDRALTLKQDLHRVIHDNRDYVHFDQILELFPTFHKEEILLVLGMKIDNDRNYLIHNNFIIRYVGGYLRDKLTMNNGAEFNHLLASMISTHWSDSEFVAQRIPNPESLYTEIFQPTSDMKRQYYKVLSSFEWN